METPSQMRTASAAGLLLFILAAFFFTGCDVTKNISEKDHLLIKNKFKINSHKITVEELSGYLQQIPNKKLLGLFRSNIAFYNMGSKGKDTKFKKWLRTKIGSAPVLLDTSLVTISIKQMKLYLANKGYFQTYVNDSIIFKKKKATVVYHVNVSPPYTIRHLTYSIPDTQLSAYVFKDTLKCLIKRGNNYDSYLMDDERTRITNNLLSYGFFRFTTNFISFRIDSSLNCKKMDITIEITNPVVPSLFDLTTVIESHHKRYFVNKIYITPDFDHIKTDTVRYDTLVKSFDGPEKLKPPSTYYFLTRDRMKIKARTISQSVFITPGTSYNVLDVNQTYSQLASLQVFKFINIQFNETLDNIPSDAIHKDLIDCKILLSRSPVHSFSITTDGTNSGGALGIQAGLSYQNRNIFRGAQLLRINFNISAQAQASSSTSGQPTGFFNTIELGANAVLTFPQFLIPIRQERLPKHFKPKTSITVGYNYQHQVDYDRHISNITFGYSWLQSDKIKHVLNPAEISLVKVFPDAYFDSVINAQQDQRLKNQYTSHMVAGLRYTFTFNNQQINKVKDFIYLRTNFETGGNLIYGLNSLFKSPKNESGQYTLFNLPYSQYIRPDVDFRYYNMLGKNYQMVYRFYAGIGIPYGNSSVLPFEKAFYSGGANGMRGWRMYTLGPGTYHNDSVSGTYSEIGDIQLEANVEFRFPVYKFFKGAVFLDAGNIWLLQNNPQQPGGVFKFNTFLSQVGIDFGIGIRLDFDFFIFRLDPAIPIRVPWYPENNRWYFNKMQFRDIVWNFGIGYPF